MPTVELSMSINIGNGYDSYHMEVDQERAEHYIGDIATNLTGLLEEMLYTTYAKHLDRLEEKEEEEEAAE